jgi:hypothetical protein
MGKTLPRMMTKKTKKRKSDDLFRIFRRFLPPVGHLTRIWLSVTLLALTGFAGAVSFPAEATAVRTQNSPHAHDFVIFVTVFTERGLALQGAKARVRRDDEKKFRWDAVSDRQGEFGIRVPRGAQYELTVEARGFKSQTRKVDASASDREDITLQMEQLAGGKS